MSKSLEAIVQLVSQLRSPGLYDSASSPALVVSGYPFQGEISRRGRTWRWVCSKSRRHELLMRNLERVQPAIVSILIVYNLGNRRTR